MSPYELMSLHLALSHLAYLEGTPFVEDLEAVIRKVEAGLPDKVRNHLERIITTFAPLSSGRSGPMPLKDKSSSPFERHYFANSRLFCTGTGSQENVHKITK